MKLGFYFTLISTFFTTLAANPTIYEVQPQSVSIEKQEALFLKIKSLNEIKNILLESDKDTLVVLDIDDLLIASKEPILHPLFEPTLYVLVKSELGKASSKEQKEKLDNHLSQLLTTPDSRLVEESTPNLLNALEKKGVKVIALTSFPSGKLGNIKEMEKWKVERLKTFGIDFSSSFPNIKRLTFHEIAKADMNPPIFQDGVLFSRGYKKGEVLVAFLDHLNLNPQNVIFVDDILENIEGVKDSLSKRKIPFKGFYFQRDDGWFNEINQDIIKLQFKNLIETSVWNSYEITSQMIECKQ